MTGLEIFLLYLVAGAVTTAVAQAAVGHEHGNLVGREVPATWAAGLVWPVAGLLGLKSFVEDR